MPLPAAVFPQSVPAALRPEPKAWQPTHHRAMASAACPSTETFLKKAEAPWPPWLQTQLTPACRTLPPLPPYTRGKQIPCSRSAVTAKGKWLCADTAPEACRPSAPAKGAASLRQYTAPLYAPLCRRALSGASACPCAAPAYRPVPSAPRRIRPQTAQRATRRCPVRIPHAAQSASATIPEAHLRMLRHARPFLKVQLPAASKNPLPIYTMISMESVSHSFLTTLFML